MGEQFLALVYFNIRAPSSAKTGNFLLASAYNPPYHRPKLGSPPFLWICGKPWDEVLRIPGVREYPHPWASTRLRQSPIHVKDMALSKAALFTFSFEIVR